MKNKIISLFLLGSLLFGGVAYPFQANAFLGLADIVIDPGHIAVNVLGWAGEAALKALEIAAKSALEAFKKRLLDQIVDNTIRYIQGGGDPKFVTDFGDTLRDAGDAAVGDVLRDVGLGELCTGLRPRRGQLRLVTPVFSQRISCTLDDVVGSIERFGDNFEVGGFIGYQEVLKPQNNRWGLEILASSEVERRRAERQDAVRQEISAGRGFLAVKQCLEWEAIGTDDNGRTVSRAFPYNDVITLGREHPSPSDPPLNVLISGINDIEWVCSEERITTPGNAIAEGLERSLYADLDYIVNSQELTTYVGAIFDAAINRLIQEGVRGVQNLGSSGSTPPTDCNNPDLSPQLQDACREYQDSVGNINDRIEEQQEEISNAGKDAEDKLREAQEASEESLTEQAIQNQCDELSGPFKEACLELLEEIRRRNAGDTESSTSTPNATSTQ